MEQPIHTHNTKYYLVLRPLLWFAKGEMIETSKMREYFTPKAITSLLKFEFIVIK